ncbi:hypothetical protein [Zoogloea sp.]|uniref:hypothetical protein n=1 Tax=Zoogloea sp. TaxID=49181 RepID=UPI00345BD1E5
MDPYGARLNASGEASLSAGGELHAYAVQDVHSAHVDRKKVTRSSLGANLFAPGSCSPRAAPDGNPRQPHQRGGPGPPTAERRRDSPPKAAATPCCRAPASLPPRPPSKWASATRPRPTPP